MLKCHFNWKNYKNEDDVIFYGILYQIIMFPHIMSVYEF